MNFRKKIPGIIEAFVLFHDEEERKGITTAKEAIEYLEFERQYKELLSSMITMSKIKGIQY